MSSRLEGEAHGFFSGELAGGDRRRVIAWLFGAAWYMALSKPWLNENFGWDLTLIDGGHWLGFLLIIGAGSAGSARRQAETVR